MSKKTESIYQTIENLQNCQKALTEYNKTAGVRELEDIEFNMGQELKKLKFLVESLYSYNGKSKSYAKKQASRENGKRGGRPPKEISLGRKRLAELDELIPELQHKLELSDDSAEYAEIKRTIEDLEKEKGSLSERVAEYLNRDLFNN